MARNERNLDNVTDADLIELAAKAFALGLEDGRRRKGPITGEVLIASLATLTGPISEWRRGHKAKLRQVYGAGFDISAMMGRVKAESVAA